MSKGSTTSKQELPEYQQRQQQELFQAAKGLPGNHLYLIQAHK